MLRRLFCLVMVLALCASCGLAEVMAVRADDAEVFAGALEMLQQYKDVRSVQDAQLLFSSIMSDYGNATLFSRYALAIASILEGELEEAGKLISKLAERQDFVAQLAGYGLPPCDELLRYIEAREAEAAGDYAHASAIYSELYIFDSFDRSIAMDDQIAAQRESLYAEALAKLSAGDYQAAAELFESLGDYRDSQARLAEALALGATPTPEPTATPGPTPTPEPTPTPAALDSSPIEVPRFDGGTLEVRIWDASQLDGLRRIADEWSALSGVKVNLQVIDWDNYWTMLEAGASGGVMPDVFWMHSNNARMYMKSRKLLDLTPYIEASSQTDLADYLPDLTEMYSLDGHQYALPKDHDTVGLLYNESLFEKYGVEVPNDSWTWDDFYFAAKAIRDAAVAAGDTNVYGVAMDTTNNQDGYYNVIYAYGGYVISEDRKSSGWNDGNTRAAMDFVGRLLADAGVPQTTVSENGTERVFRGELAAMVLQGSWMIRDFMARDGAASFKWAMLPYHDANGNGACDPGERVTIYNGLGWVASANTAHPDEAWSLIEWFGSRAMQLKQAELGVAMAACDGCSGPFAAAFGDTDISAFLRMESDATLVFRPHSKYTSRWETESQQQLVAAWNDPSRMGSVLDSLAASMNNWLAQE